MSEQELLGSFARNADQQAFRQLVDRYTGLVYAGALRRVGAGLADDVVQAVFLVLARKSEFLSRRRELKLAAWLHVTTGFVSRETLRAEARRHAREARAHADDLMKKEAQDGKEGWDDIRPYIDAALDRLSETDREAIICRFFKGESFPEIGERLHTSPNTATKRVTRALERMRTYLQGRGITVAAPSLGLMLGAQRADALGLGLQELREHGMAAIGPGLSESVLGVAHLSIKTAMVSQIKAMAPLAVLALGLLGGSGTLVWRSFQPSSVPFEVSRLAPLDLSLEGFARLPDGSIAYQINARQGKRTYFVKSGETVEGYRLTNVESASRAEAHTAVKLVHASGTLTLVRDTSSNTSSFMVLISTADRADDWVCIGDLFETANGEYECVAIDAVGAHILVKALTSGDITRVTVR